MVQVERRYHSPTAAMAAVGAAAELGLGVALTNRLSGRRDAGEEQVEWLLTLTAAPAGGDLGAAGPPPARPESVISLREHEPVARGPEPDLFVADSTDDLTGRHRRHARPDV